MRSVSHVSLLIMAALAGKPKHGYAIMRDVENVAGKALGPGTLYGAIARLEESGLIEALPGDERRRPYRLTSTGRRVLREELVQVKMLSSSLHRLAAT